MITRDPLSIPCLTEKYWATMSKVPGRDLARMVTMVRGNKPTQPLPRVSQLDEGGKLRVEEEHVRACFARAEEVGL